MSNENNIELRSEKVRNIIGQIPPRLIRTGSGVFLAIFILISAGIYFYTFPYKIQTEANLWQTNDSINYSVLIPSNKINQLGSDIQVSFDLYGNRLQLNTVIDFSTNKKPILNSNGIYYDFTGSATFSDCHIVDTVKIDAVVYGRKVNVIELLLAR